MKRGRCPKCEHTKIYVVEDVRQPAQESINTIHKMNVTCAAVPSRDLGLAEDNDHRAAIGTWDAWICAGCGFTEWYAKDVGAAFDRLLALGRKVHVRLAAPAPDDGPYR